MNTRDENEIVPLQVRLREDLRRSLEEAAKAKRISLNQEIIDRLEYVRDRQGLLAEVLRLTFGERLAGLLLALGHAMAAVASIHRLRHGGDRDRSSPSEWIDDPATFNETIRTATVLLEAARPEGGKTAPDVPGRQVITTTGFKDRRPTPSLLLSAPAKEVQAMKELLGPVDQRMTTVLRVRDILISRIMSGEWKPNAPIPNATDLARQLGVANGTVRRALDLMLAERLIEPAQAVAASALTQRSGRGKR